MLRVIKILFFIVSFYAHSADDKKIVLSQTSIGNMPIELGMKISLYKIRNYFPYYRVTQEIAEGDSPDYHLFVVSTHEGEALISFISYINAPTSYEESVVKLDEVIIYSPKTQDEFGVSPGMPIEQASAKIKGLEFGAGHMDYYLGKGRIWYLFTVSHTHDESVTKQMALKQNPKIEGISWPYPRWH